MIIIADLQIHSKHSRATSKNISIENLEKWARIKGLDLLGIGDFQHPLWRKEIDEKLSENEKGILKTKSGFSFIWQTEVSLIYSFQGKKRAVHLLVFAPNKNVANQITCYLGKKGRLDYDGRPIFGINAIDFVSDLKKIDEMIEIIPAHCLTPYFGVFGSRSGFDSLKECFQDQVQHIYAIESGISADPEMLWRFKEVASGKVNIVSFSDAHSYWPFRLGREATIFDIDDLSYENIIKAIRTGQGLKATIETPPEYGRYHFDGHSSCKFSCDYKQTKQIKGICPVCKKKLNLGVENRSEKISSYKKGFIPENSKPFYKILPLQEIISIWKGVGINSKSVWNEYNSLIDNFKNEFNVLLNISFKDLTKVCEKDLANLIIKNRKGKLKMVPGFDGLYGKILI